MTGKSLAARLVAWATPLASASPLGLGLTLALATLISEDLTCIGAGLLVANDRISFLAASLACLAGIFAGDLALVLAGRWLGPPSLRRPPLSWFVHPASVERSARWFAEQGPVVVMFSRFVPGSRVPLFVAAGILRAPFVRIALALLLAGGLWTPLLVGLSAATGGAILARLELFEHWALPIAIAAAMLVLLVVRVLLPALTWRGRRLLLSRWRRWTRWEFWPLWLFNAPVVAHWLWLGLRYRSFTLFTAANPGILAGGFVLESKSAILGRLHASEALPRFRRLDLPPDPELRSDLVRRVHAEDGFGFPVVGKPDVGERGEGVRVLRSPEELDAWARTADTVSLLQEYVPGEEFGVFWARRPSEASGRIISITSKQFTAVVGDGHSTLETLILADDRAVCQAPIHLENHLERLDWVPPAGSRVPLVEIGNHCRGTTFRDGRSLATPELARRIDEIGNAIDGFYFGRLDLRAPSLEDFRGGRGLRVLEVNGVTSEATHIYEPGASLLAGWKTIFDQWRLAFEIGRENAARGAPVASLTDLIRLLAERHRRRRAPGSGRMRRRASLAADAARDPDSRHPSNDSR